MAQKKETAEQQLLKMLEASAGPAAVAPKVEKKAKGKQSVLSLIRIGNKVLIAVIVGVAFFLVGEVLAGMSLVGKNVRFSVNSSSVRGAKGSENFLPMIEGLSFYLSGVKRRNLFQPYDEERKKIAVDVSGENRRIAQATSHLRLVGVSWLDTVATASVMLEDIDKKETYFLQKGEKIGDIFVKTIYADSVELGYENEEILIKYDQSQM
ncbi:hypothetical protein MNBD_UNCLBAC01-1527 [hydrothermal vent metagenome]|uniref:Uncharacterized protein n=1 Tax=hydrothermal vent metagenome TaxID=652676 RepID=A0A3B1DFY1_9ZZZZ